MDGACSEGRLYFRGAAQERRVRLFFAKSIHIKHEDAGQGDDEGDGEGEGGGDGEGKAKGTGCVADWWRSSLLCG